jgi:hypothetical protein
MSSNGKVSVTQPSASGGEACPSKSARSPKVFGRYGSSAGETRTLTGYGGLYAVTRCEVNKPWEDIPGTWQKLVKWMEGSKYHHGSHQWLEEHLGPLDAMGGDQPFMLDLHLPIRE